MIAPYTAVGLVTTVRGVRRRDEIRRNLDHVADVMGAASWLSSLDLPVRLVAIPEGALQGFTDEVFDLDHATYAREVAIDVPGEETDFLAELARHWGVFFNVGFDIDPRGEVVLRHHKLATLYPVEHSVTPHDVWDRWVERYGRTLDAFYPVADTEIGRLGVMMANEGSYPENARGLAMNGAEVVYRASYPHPHTGNEFFEVQNRARALDNNFYVVAPNLGRVVGQHQYGAGASYVAGTVDIQALRDFRARAQWDNWLKDLRTEQYQLVYEQPIYPRNLYLDRPPYSHDEFRREVIEKQVRKLHELGIWVEPASGD